MSKRSISLIDYPSIIVTYDEETPLVNDSDLLSGCIHDLASMFSVPAYLVWAWHVGGTVKRWDSDPYSQGAYVSAAPNHVRFFSHATFPGVF